MIWKVFYIDHEPTHMKKCADQFALLISKQKIPVKVISEICELHIIIMLPDFTDLVIDDVLNLIVKVFAALEAAGKNLDLEISRMQIFEKDWKILDSAFSGLLYDEKGQEAFLSNKIATFAQHGVAMELDESQKDLIVTIALYPDEQGAASFNSFKKGVILLFYQMCYRDRMFFENYSKVTGLLESIKKL